MIQSTIDRKTLLDNLYKTIKNDETKDLNIYIDTPFCIKKCAYCIYKPIQLTSKKVFDDYYDYIFNYLEEAQEVLKNANINTIYFGGGTASLMSFEILSKIASLIPNFENIPFKSIEFHPVMLNQQKIDFIIKNKFTYVSIGLQTINSDLLKEQNRDFKYNLNKLSEYIKQLRENNIVVSIDILTYMGYNTHKNYDNIVSKRDLTICENDIKVVAEILKPSQICIYPNTYYLYSLKEKGLQEEAFKFKRLIYNIQKKIDYRLLPNENNLDYNDFGKKSSRYFSRNYYLYAIDYKKMETSGYTCDFPQEKEPSLLAIGGLRGNCSDKFCFGKVKNNFSYNTSLTYDNGEFNEQITTFKGDIFI